MDLMSLMVRIGADTKDAEKGISKVQKLGNTLSKGLKTAAKGAGIALGAAATAVTALTKSAVEAYGKYEQLVGGVETLFGTGGKSLEEYAGKASTSMYKLNQRGEDVKKLQKELIAAGYDLGKAGADGIYGPATQKAYEEYIKAAGGATEAVKAEYNKRIEAQNTVLENSKKAYKTAGMSANEYMETVTGFSASLIQSLGGDTKKAAELADQAIIDMSDNANKMGTDVESIKNAYAGFAKQNFTMLDNLKLGYGGTKEEMQRLLDKAGEISGYKYDISSYADIVEAIHVVQEEMGITGTTAKEADKTIQGSLTATKAAWENVITAMAGGNLDLQDSIDALVESGINTINNVWPVISNALSGIADLVKQVAPIIAENLPGLINEVLPKLLDAAITLLGGVAQALPGLFQVVLDAIGKLFTTIKAYIDERNPGLGRAIDNVVDFFVTAWENITKFWNTTLKPALDDIWKFISETVVPKAEEAWNSLKITAETVFASIKNFWDNTLKPALDALWKFIVDVVVPKAKEAWDKFKTAAATVFAAVKNFWDNTLKPALDSLWKFISETVVPKAGEAWDKFKTTISTVFAAVKGYWDTVLKPAFEAITDFVVEVLWPAIRDNFSFIKNKVTDAFNGIKKFWNETLKPAFESLVDFLGDILGPAFDIVTGAINGDKDSLNTLKEAIVKLLPWITGITAAFIAYKAAVAISTIIDAVRNSTGLLTIAQTLLNAVMNANPFVLIASLLAGLVTAFITAYETNEDFRKKVDEAWKAIKTTAEDVWKAITGWITDFTDKVSQIWEDAKNWGVTIFDNFKTSIQTGWDNIKQWFNNLWDEIKAIPQKLVDAALNWGKDLIANFKKGIEDTWEDIKKPFNDVGNWISDHLGFSVPKEGPLSDFDTYAPDMMALFAQGIRDTLYKVIQEIDGMAGQIEKRFNDMGKNAKNGFMWGLDGYWGGDLAKAIKNPFESVYNSLLDMNWMRIGWNVKDTFLDGLDGLYDSVKRVFDFSSIYVKTPHFWVTKWNEIAGSYYPEMTVKWYRKAYDNAVMFTRPTVLGTSSGAKGFGDGPGAEVVLSESKLRDLVGAGGGTTNNTFNIYQRDGEGMEALARRIEQIMTRNENQRKAAYA